MTGSDRQRKLERVKYSLGMVFCLISLLCAAYAAATIDLPVFGPKRYDRLKGAPTVYTDTFERCRPAYSAILRITNGDSQATRIKSASIMVNGVEVASENDFKQQAPYFEKNIAVADINQLTVALKSGMQDDPNAKNLKDQSFLIIEIAGTGCDDTPPVIYNLSPSDGSLIKAASPLVSARFADNADGLGIDPASARMNVDDREVTLSASASQTGISYQPDTLPEGGHTVSASVSDNAGNAVNLSWKFTTDTVPPAVAVTSHRNGQYLNTGMITLSGTVQDPLPAQPAFTTGPVIVTVSGVAAEVYGDEFILAGFSLYEGLNSIRVEALDAAGNKASAGVILNLDTVAPVVSITFPPDNVFLNTPVITVSGTVSEEFTTVKVNGNPATVTGTDFSFVRLALSEGVNVLFIEAFDPAGNRSTKTVSVNLDTVPPTAAISHAPASPTNATTANITVAGPDVVAYKYNLDGGSFHAETAPSMPIMLTDLPEGTHNLYVIGKDLAGNWQPASSATIVIWIVDRTAPALNVSALPDGAFTNNSVLNVSGTVTDNVGVQGITINDSTITVNEDGSFSQAVILTTGANQITAIATDQAGNQITNVRTITLDMTAPQLVIISPVDNSVTGSAQVNVTGTVDETSTVSMKVNCGEAQSASVAGNNWNAASHLTYGQNTIEVTATDRAGNSTIDKRTVTYDNVNPTLAVTNPSQDVVTNQPSITLEGTVTDLTAPTVTITHDGTTYTPVVTNGTYHQTLSLSMGKTYSITVIATDAAGNQTTVQRNIIYDATPPTVMINPVTTPTNQRSQTISGTMEANSKVNVTSSTAAAGQAVYPTTTTWQVELTNMMEGDNAVSVTVTDQAGNVSNSMVATIALDTTPLATTAAPSDGVYGPGLIVMLTTNETATIYYTTDGSTPTTDSSVYNGPISIPAATILRFFAVDLAGNPETVKTVTYLIDNTPPAGSIAISRGAGYTNSLTVTLALGCADDLSGCSSMQFSGDNQTWTTSEPFTSTKTWSLAPGDGQKIVYVKYTDGVGNMTLVSVSIILDTIAPLISINTPTTPISNNSQTLRGSVEAGLFVTIASNTTASIGPVSYPTATSWSCTISGLAAGSNIITATATDGAGNTSSSMITLDPSLIGLWHMDGDWNDASGNGNNGTGYNGVTFGNDKIDGKAGSFDGIDDYVAGNKNYITSAANTFTIQLWAYPTGSRSATTESNSGISGAGGQRYAVAPGQAGGNAGAGISVGNNGISVFEHGDYYLPSLLVYNAPITGWNQVVVVYQNKQPKLYVNGQFIKAGSTSQRSSVYPSLLFGNVNTYGPYQGLLDEVTIYNRALSAQEIVNLYNATPPFVTITSPTPGATSNNRPLLSYTVSAGSVVTVKVDGNIVPKASGSNLDALPDGTHTVRVESVNSTGIMGFNEVTVTVDTTPPNLGIDPVVTPTNSISQTITGTRESNSTITVSVNTSAVVGAVAYPTSTTWSCTLTKLAQTTNNITVTAKDAAGNSINATASITLLSLNISSVSISNNILDVSTSNRANIFFTIDAPATVSLKIYTEKLGPKSTPLYVENKSCATAGAYVFSWDGRNPAGQIVPDEAYLYVLEASDAVRFASYNPPASNASGSVSSCSFDSFNPYQNDPMIITFSVPQPTRVSLSLLTADYSGNQIVSLIDSAPYAPGTYQYVWDGWKPGGTVLYKNGIVRCSPVKQMRENTLVVTGGTPVISQFEVDPLIVQLSFGQLTRIRYTLSRDSLVTVKITSPSGTVNTVVSGALRVTGFHNEEEWRGIDPSDPTGKKLLISEEGDYTVSIQAVDANTGASAIRRGLLHIMN